jgi:hypothetical protein
MSLLGSLLALVVIPLKAKPRKTEVETFALNYWRDAGAALMKEVAELRLERDYWRATADNWRAVATKLEERRRDNARQELAVYERQYGPDCTCIPSRSQVLRP